MRRHNELTRRKSRRVRKISGCNGLKRLENRQADPVGLPRLAHLLLDDEAGGGHRRVNRAGTGFRIADRTDQMVDCRLFAPMPNFQETPGRAQVFHDSSRGGWSDLTSHFCNAWLQIVKDQPLGNHPISRETTASVQLLWAYAARTLLPYG